MRWLALILLVLLGALRAQATIVWAYAENAYTSGANCAKLPHQAPTPTAQDGWTSLDCTASQYSTVAVPVPPGGGHTVTAEVEYRTPDQGASKKCVWAIGFLSHVMACSAGTTGCSGAVCPACHTDADCPGGTCSVAPTLNIFPVLDLGTATGQFTHVDSEPYHTTTTAAVTIQRYQGSATSWIDCTANECNNSNGHAFVWNYYTGSDASSCNWDAIKFDFLP